MTEIVEDVEVVDEAPEAVEPSAPASVELVRRPRRSELIKPFAADALVAGFREYQALCERLLEPSDYQDTGQGKTFKKKSAWRKLAVAFDLDVQIIRNDVERDDTGQPVRAVAWARAIAPSGRFQDGDGYCSVDEPRFAEERGRQKLENDLRATATTRAKNRAISDLLGTGEVSAEEVDGGGAGPKITPKQISNFIMRRAQQTDKSREDVDALCKRLFGVDKLEDLPRDKVEALAGAITDPQPTGESDVPAPDQPSDMAEDPGDLPWGPAEAA